MNYDKLPPELRERRQWVAAHIYPSPKRAGKSEKMPINPATGGAAESNNPATCGSFADAVRRMEHDGLEAIGFVFTSDDPYIGIDFDGVIDADGNIEQWALDYVRLVGSYAERSYSKTGLHIIVRGALPPGGRKRGQIEMYDCGRFFVFTGDALDGFDTITEAQAAVNLLHRETFGERQPMPEPTRQPAQVVNLDDADLIAKAMAAHNGGKFTELWNGNTNGYPSQSEADYALCSLLGFWAGGDAGRVESLFRQSGLYREKWNESHDGDGTTYGAMTVANALRSLSQVYDGNGRQPPDVNFSGMAETGEPPAWMGADGEELPHIQSAAVKQTTAQGVTDNPATWADMARLIGPVQWDWPGWLPQSLMTMLVSDSGVGKSIFAGRIAGTYLCGWPWPDGTPYTGEPGKVLWVEAEAAQAINLERAVSWGLPIENILSPFVNPLDDANLFDATHLAAIHKTAARDDVRLVIVDSLSGATGGKSKGDDMMPVVKWLAELARNLCKPVLVLHHLRKRGMFDTGDSVTLDRVRDSTVIIQPARVVWAIDVPNANDDEHKRLKVIKSNLGRFPEAVGLRINDTGLTFDEAPQPPKPETQTDKAVDLLKALLAPGPRKSTELQQEAVGAGISWDTMTKAQKRLGVVARKDGRAGWMWALPYSEQEPEEQEPDNT